MKTYTINNKKYYQSKNLIEAYPKIFKGCNNGKTFIAKNEISTSKFLYARYIDDEWIVTNGSSYKFDKLFMLKSWFKKTYLDDVEESDTEDAPDVIGLEDHEKFIDNDDNVIEIEVRGERDFNKCYFNVKDIMKGFDIKRLNEIVTDKRYNGYIINEHYKYFYFEKDGAPGNKKIKKLFLTYVGLLRVLFASQKKTADKFIHWASETLFIAQMGNINQRTKLVSNLLGVSTQSVREVFNKTTNTMPCIYLYSLGKVKDLRKVLKIGKEYKDDDFVYKWGMTIDLERRTGEHERSLGKLNGVNLQLVTFGFIDPQYISKAETQIESIFKEFDLVFEHEKYIELAIIPKNKMKIVKEQYSLISKVYMGHIAELVNKIKDKDNELALLKALHAKEIALINNQLIIAQKDLEIATLKLNAKCK